MNRIYSLTINHFRMNSILLVLLNIYTTIDITIVF